MHIARQWEAFFDFNQKNTRTHVLIGRERLIFPTHHFVLLGLGKN